MAKDSKKSKTKSNKRKLNLKGKVTLVLGILAVIAIVAVGVVYGTYKSYYSKMNYQAAVEKTELGRGMFRILNGDIGTLMWSDHVYNVLLIGQDTRVQGENGRSDAMILVSINKQTEEIIMTSLMRDVWVHIPGYGAERLNQAYEYGGAQLLIDTVETNFHIRIDNYMTIDFYAFMDMVDALGGVEMTITDAEVENMLYYFHYEINPMLGRPLDTDVIETGGTYTLNGVQTLAYVRCRYLEGGDFGRTERQRKVLNVIFERFKSCSVPEMLDVLEVVLPYITTDIDEETMFSLLTNTALQYKDYKLVTHTVPYEGTWENWIHELTGETKDVLSVDIELNSQIMIKDIYKIEIAEEDDMSDASEDVTEVE